MSNLTVDTIRKMEQDDFSDFYQSDKTETESLESYDSCEARIDRLDQEKRDQAAWSDLLWELEPMFCSKSDFDYFISDWIKSNYEKHQPTHIYDRDLLWADTMNYLSDRKKEQIDMVKKSVRYRLEMAGKYTKDLYNEEVSNQLERMRIYLIDQWDQIHKK